MQQHHTLGDISRDRSQKLKRINSERITKNSEYFNTYIPKKRKQMVTARMLRQKNTFKQTSNSFRTNKEINDHQLVVMRSTSRKNKFENKIEKLALNRTNGVYANKELIIYQNEIDYLRKELIKKEEEVLALKRDQKLVKCKQLQIEIKQVYNIMHKFQGMLEKANQIIELYESNLKQGNLNKKVVMKQLREDNIKLNGEFTKIHYENVTMESRLLEITKTFQHNERKLKKTLKEKEETIVNISRTVRPVESPEHLQTKAELEQLKKRVNSLEDALQHVKIENERLYTELQEQKQALSIKQSEIELLERNLKNLKSDKSQIESRLYTRIQQLEVTKKQSYIDKRASIVTAPKKRERIKLVRLEEVEHIAKMIQFRLIHKNIEHASIPSLIDSAKFQNPLYPNFTEIRQMLSNNIFNLNRPERQLFSRYLLENNSPVSDDSDTQHTNTLSIVKAILEKTIPKYSRLNPTEEITLIDSISTLFDKNKTLIEKIRKSLAKEATEFITVAHMKNYFQEYYVVVKDDLFSYMELKSFQLTGVVGKLNIFKLRDYFDRQTIEQHKQEIISQS